MVRVAFPSGDEVLEGMLRRDAPLASIGFPDREEFSRVENVRHLRLTAFLKRADRHRDQYLFSAEARRLFCHGCIACTMRRHANAR
jgi:hypothetical protein